MMTRTSETVLTQYDSSQTCDNEQNTCIHVNTHEKGTGIAVPIMIQYDTCQLVQKWFLVCWGTMVAKLLTFPVVFI